MHIWIPGGERTLFENYVAAVRWHALVRVNEVLLERKVAAPV
jgi:hypothetical protein